MIQLSPVLEYQIDTVGSEVVRIVLPCTATNCNFVDLPSDIRQQEKNVESSREIPLRLELILYRLSKPQPELCFPCGTQALT